jgi:hypothetical protein
LIVAAGIRIGARMNLDHSIEILFTCRANGHGRGHLAQRSSEASAPLAAS